jgi:hypothetical protein
MFKRLIKIPVYLAVLVFILFEEIIWEQIAAPIARYMQSLNIFTRIESVVSRLNGITILFVFIILFAFAEGLGLVAAAFIVKGKAFFGAMIYIGKLPLASFSFWLFKISKEKMLQIRWFAHVYHYVIYWFDKIKASEYYQHVYALSFKIKVGLKSLIKKEKSSFGTKIKRLYFHIKSKN